VTAHSQKSKSYTEADSALCADALADGEDEGLDARVLAGLVHFCHPEARGPALAAARDSLILEIHKASTARMGHRSQILALVFARRFRSRWLAAAESRLAAERESRALSLFSENELLPLSAVAFAAAVAQKERRAERTLLAEARASGEPWGDRALDDVRIRLVRRTLWEASVRALPAALLIAAAVVAVVMLLRVLKLPL